MGNIVFDIFYRNFLIYKILKRIHVVAFSNFDKRCGKRSQKIYRK